MTVVYTDDVDHIIRLRVIHGPWVAYRGLTDLEARLMENHLQDPSTGTYRERASILLSDAEPWPGQHDYDAKRNERPIEIKPRTWKPSGNGKKKSANGYGSINDHSLSRHEKFMNDDLIMQQSQFFDGCCAWVIEFPYRWLETHMVNQISKSKTRVCGKFNYTHWIECPDIEVKWLNRSLVEFHKENIVGGSFKEPKTLYKWLIEQDIDSLASQIELKPDVNVNSQLNFIS